VVIGNTERFQQVLCRAEAASFCNLALSVNGVPNARGFHTPGSDPAAGLTIANPAFTAEYETAENEEVRNRAYRNTPVLLTRRGEVSGDLYVRGNGADDTEVFTDPVFAALDAFFGVRNTHTVEHDVALFNTATKLDILGAYTAGLRAGMGFHIVLPSGKSFVSFVTEIKDNSPSSEDAITFAPPLIAAELVECQAQPADSVKLRGGRTYAIGDEYADAMSLYLLLLKQAYAQEVFGARGATLAANLEVGQAGVFNATWQGPYTHQGGYAPAKVVTTWDTVDKATLADVTGLVVGMYISVTTTVAPAGAYILRIRAINGLVVSFEPTDLPAGITTEAPVPALAAITPGATAAPSGSWLVFLNGRAWVDGEYRDIRSANWQIALNPVAVPTPNNMAGAIDAAMGDPEITCEIVYSAYDDGAQFQHFANAEEFSVLCMLGDGTAGNAVALYMPAAHNTSAPMPGEIDSLTTLETTLRAGLCTTDDDAYNGTDPSNTICRLFFAW